MYRLIDINEGFDNLKLNAFRLFLISYLQLVFFVSPQNCYVSVGPHLTRHQSSLPVAARGVYPFPFPSPPAPTARA